MALSSSPARSITDWTPDCAAVVSTEYASLKGRLATSEGRHRTLQQVSSDLQRVIGGTTTNDPWTGLPQLQKEAGTVGLRARALVYGQISSWVTALGGEAEIRTKVAHANAVASLVQDGGFDGFKKRWHMLMLWHLP